MTRGDQCDIAILFPALPPALDGIGDHTAKLARALAPRGRVRIFTAQPDADPIPGVVVHRVFSTDRPQDVLGVVSAVSADPPDWLVVQFNQFSYGRWGFNPFLPLALHAVKRRCPKTRIAWVVHEDFVPLTSWKFAVMTTWQRAQFVALGRLADLICYSIEPWAEKYAAWFPHADVRHLPVGSNFDPPTATRVEAKRALGFDDAEFVVGIFGSIGHARLLSFLVRSVEALSRERVLGRVLYVGPSESEIQRALGSVPMYNAGRLPPADVSRHLAAMDLHLSPFADGVSTRRGSFMAGLQHGVASATTIGVNTGVLLRKAAGHAFAAAEVADAEQYEAKVLQLAKDSARRAILGAEGRALYDKAFAFEQIAQRLVAAMDVTIPQT